MRIPIRTIAVLSVLATPLAIAAETKDTDVFLVRFNQIEAPTSAYQNADAAALGYPAALTDAHSTEAPEEGRKAMAATLGQWAGKVYEGIMAKLTGDRPSVNSPSPIQLTADPRAYQAAGLKADAQLSALGLNSKLGMRLGTEEIHQTIRFSRDCGVNFLPNSVSGDVAGGFGSVKGTVQGSWGSACSSGQSGWRLTAGVNDLGHDPYSTLGMEYRPVVGSLIANVTGISAMKAQLAEAGGSVGLEAPVPAIRIANMRLNAEVNWHEDSGTALKLGTSLKF